MVDRALTGFGSTGVRHTPLYRPDDTADTADTGDTNNGNGHGNEAECAVNLMRLTENGRIARPRCVGGPEVSTGGMTANELAEFAGYRWVPIRELDALPDRVEPADLAGVIRQLI